MATSRTAVSASAVTDTLHRTLVWLDVRLGLLFAVGVPLVLLVWAMLRRQQAITRLLGLYWTVASLQLIKRCRQWEWVCSDVPRFAEREEF